MAHMDRPEKTSLSVGFTTLANCRKLKALTGAGETKPLRGLHDSRPAGARGRR